MLWWMLPVEFPKLLFFKWLPSREKCEHFCLLSQPFLPLSKPCPVKMTVSSEGNRKLHGDQTRAENGFQGCLTEQWGVSRACAFPSGLGYASHRYTGFPFLFLLSFGSLEERILKTPSAFYLVTRENRIFAIGKR